MSGFGVWTWVVVFVAVLVPAAIVAAIVWASVRLSRNAKAAPALPGGSVEGRLSALDDLRTRGQISEDEYRTQRAAIIASI
ncbi:MAG: SHOCT domain-containing protein [Xanthomonadales bacterium]|nr:SHOCT domain-containing protein [Xanthomonadales bacterium]